MAPPPPRWHHIHIGKLVLTISWRLLKLESSYFIQVFFGTKRIKHVSLDTRWCHCSTQVAPPIYKKLFWPYLGDLKLETWYFGQVFLRAVENKIFPSVHQVMPPAPMWRHLHLGKLGEWVSEWLQEAFLYISNFVCSYNNIILFYPET